MNVSPTSLLGLFSTTASAGSPREERHSAPPSAKSPKKKMIKAKSKKGTKQNTRASSPGPRRDAPSIVQPEHRPPGWWLGNQR